jgi:hypothetical protein
MSEQTPKRARLCLDGWAGRSSVAVEVIGETAKRYRVRFLEATTLPHLASAEIGDVKLVPKYSVVIKG